MFAGQVMMEGVMHQAEHIQAADGLDRLHRHALAPQGTLFKTQGLDKAENSVVAQDRRQLAQGRAQTGGTLGFIARVARLIERAHHQALGAAFTGVGRQCDCLGPTLVVPHIKRVQRVDRQHGNALHRAQFTHAAGRGAEFDLLVGQVVANLDRIAFERCGQLDEIRQGQVGSDHAVKGET